MADKKKEPPNLLRSITSHFVLLVLIVWLIQWIDPSLIPYTIQDVWSFHGTGFLDWMMTGLPLLAWGVAATLFNVGRSKDGKGKATRGELFVGGTLISIWAGVSEELDFRWLRFFAMYGFVALVNHLFFGFMGFGLAEWFNVNLWAPVANFFTLGKLEPQLLGPWLTSAALLASNMRFRDGHKYLGYVGFVNAWFCGMYFFYIMFKHGLLASILIHFLYDFFIFTIAAFTVGKRKSVWDIV